ncbi:hypothetical protein JCM33374_g1086 [Metschnikowia sp. JCM 33374]|nr:hypothetical protein JCM33374_g1086 [Metschnikowia sp. JCM 33374]
MSFAKEFEDDFGPVRLASKEEIQKEHLQRKSRWKSGNPQGLANPTKSDASGQRQSDNTPEKDPLEEASRVSPSETKAKPGKRKLRLAGHDELVNNAPQLTTPESTEEPPKRRKLMFVPMDESHKKQILGESSRKLDQPQEEHVSEISHQDPEQEHNMDSIIVSSSGSSDLEFEDACDAFQGPVNEPSGPTSTAAADIPIPKTEEILVGDAHDPTGELIEVSIEESIEEPIGDTGEENDQDNATGTEVSETKNNSPKTVEPTEEDVQKMRELVLAQVNGVTPLKIEKSSLYQAYTQIYSVFSHTIHGSESHTALLTGAPGTGKTEIVEQALTKLNKENPGKFIAIRLSGSLHSTDQHAIREIARQLDMKLKDFTDRADESDGDSEGNTYEQRAISDTFHNILSALLSLTNKFTGNPKQTLLYNLFELSQASKVPICIVGITPKVTIREHFEKRVRSRFSQRMIQTKKADTMETFWLNSKISLTVPQENFGDFSNKDYPKEWNANIETLFRSRSGLTKTVFRTYYTTKNYRQINNESALAIKNITKMHPFPKSEDFEAYSKNATRGVEAAIASLSATELIVVVAAARWIAKSELPHVNFKLAFKEYTEMMKAMNTESTTLSSKTSYIDNMSLAGIKITMKTHSPTVLRGCWRVVYRTGLLFDVISSNSEVNANNNLNMYKETMLDDFKMLQLDVSLEELAKLIPEDNFVRRFTRL